jgi:hypothetical protein
MFIVFSPPPLDVHALKDYLRMSLMWLVLSIPPATYMEKQRVRKHCLKVRFKENKMLQTL